MSAIDATYWAWGAWYASWCIAAASASRAVSRPRAGLGGLHRLLALAGVILLFVPRPLPGRGVRFALTAPLWAEPALVSWLQFALTVAGFAFCWWARLHLGTFWSGFVTTKAEHRIVDTGPYRLVRHPIYTGVIFAALTTALIKGSPVALLGAALIWVGFWLTARTEERFLREQLGETGYDAYSRRTPMLVPWTGVRS